jgi:NAD(P)-dependent dehydrogenase (short-subunit alcohol dehydrogenase family)
MPEKRIALVTGANQGVGLQVAKELVANGLIVLFGSRHFDRGESAEAKEQSQRAECAASTPTSHVCYADGCTHRKCGWSGCSIDVVVSSMRLRKRNSRSVLRASARLQCRTS